MRIQREQVTPAMLAMMSPEDRAKYGLGCPVAAIKTPTAATQAKSTLAVKFEEGWLALNGPAYMTELQVVPERRFRFDYAWPEERVALELQGGIYLPGKGGHVAPTGFKTDCDKLNLGRIGLAASETGNRPGNAR